MKLSNQAMGAIMMALQNSLMEQTDIVPVLQSFEFVKSHQQSRQPKLIQGYLKPNNAKVYL